MLAMAELAKTLLGLSAKADDLTSLRWLCEQS